MQALDQWLVDTQKFAPGSNMIYFSDNPRERRLLIDYLRTAGTAR